jgi:hypothetical protein
MEVRGLLCYRCNSILRTYVTKEWVENALRYLKHPPYRAYTRSKT